MKSTKKLLGLITIMAIIGFGFTACDGDETPFIPQKSAPFMEMVKINGGTFKMGSPSEEAGRSTNENYRTENDGKVTLSDFYMGKYPVTQAQYKSVMGTNPSYFQGSNLPAEVTKENNLPVETVSWFDAIIFCNKLSIKEGLSPAYKIEGKTDPSQWGEKPTSSSDENYAKWNEVEIVPSSKGYRLPTEAQWEYACRAGTTTRFWSGDEETSLADKANVADQAAKEKYPSWTIVEINDGYAETSPVGVFAPNAWGLYDMHGNVLELCWDWYAASYDNAGGSNNPKGADAGTSRVRRGSSWSAVGQYLRSAQRGGSSPGNGSNNLGFRLVRP